MKNANALQVFSIISVIIIIILVVVLVIFNNKSTEQLAKTDDALKRASAAEKSASEANAQVLKLKEMIGHRDEVEFSAIEEGFQADLGRYVRGDNSVKSYRVAMANLANELTRKNEELKTNQDNLNALQTDFDNLNEMYATVVDQFSKAQTDAITDLANARKDFEGNLDTQRKEFEKVRQENEKIKQQAKEQIESAQNKAEENEKRAKDIEQRNNEMAEVLDDLRRTNFDRPNGKILSVNQQSGLVVVDLGSADGLMTRMTFSVYSPRITGISFGSTDPGEEAHVCEVCKREASLNAAKASIEIVRILGPHKSEARILDDLLTDPIVANDVIYTPIWKPGQKQHFALGAGLRIPGIGSRDGLSTQSNLEEVKRLIAANGGVVDCYISDGSEDGKLGSIVGEINRNTTFLVLGDLNEEDQQSDDVLKANSQLIETASQMAVKQISLRELLSRMAWKNVTPVRGFGKFASESDQRIAPTGEHRPSTSPVSPLYQLRNDKIRISNEDRSARPSTGTVTDLYKNSPPPSNYSTGKTSELFRPRKPSEDRTTGQSE